MNHKNSKLSQTPVLVLANYLSSDEGKKVYPKLKPIFDFFIEYGVDLTAKYRYGGNVFSMVGKQTVLEIMIRGRVCLLKMMLNRQ
jgi:hypothetical protein